VDDGVYAERRLNIATLNSFDGTTINEQSFEAGTHMSGQVTVGDTIEAKDLAADSALESIYIVGTASNKLSNANPNDGKFFIMKMIKDDNASDTRSGYARDDYHNAVNDYDNNLQWDDFSNFATTDSYANASCNDGWRLPTRSELQTTVDASLNPAINSIFAKRESDLAYWTSESNDTNSYFALEYLDKAFNISAYPSSDWLYYRCMRDLPR
jgi:hypothetical protein